MKTLVKSPMTKVVLMAEADHIELSEGNTYDVAAVRIRAVDEHGNVLPFYHEPVQLFVEPPTLELIGPDVITLHGGMGGTYVKTKGRSGAAVLMMKTAQAEAAEIRFQVK